MYKERRDDPRFKHAIEITYIMDDGTTFKVCKMKNISKGGATIQVDSPMTPKDLLTLSLPNSEEQIEAEIVWCQVDPVYIGKPNDERMYQCGVKYKEVITEKVQEILDELESRK
jgi:hypothetical protein